MSHKYFQTILLVYPINYVKKIVQARVHIFMLMLVKDFIISLNSNPTTPKLCIIFFWKIMGNTVNFSKTERQLGIVLIHRQHYNSLSHYFIIIKVKIKFYTFCMMIIRELHRKI